MADHYLNFAARREHLVPITAFDGSMYELRGNVSADIMLPWLDVQQQLDSILGYIGQDMDGKSDEEQVHIAASGREQYAAYFANVTHLCGDIFRFTYPEMADAEVTKHFSIQEQQEIIGYFFNKAGTSSSTPTTATVPATMNRKDRRTLASQKRKKSSESAD